MVYQTAGLLKHKEGGDRWEYSGFGDGIVKTIVVELRLRTPDKGGQRWVRKKRS